MKKNDITPHPKKTPAIDMRRAFLRYSTLPLLAPLATWAQSQTNSQSTPTTTKESPPEAEKTIALPEPRAQFMHIAPILCNKIDIRPQMLKAAFETLEQNDPQFKETLEQLFKFATTENLTSAQMFAAHKKKSEYPLAQQAAKQILTVLYTGRIGQGAQSQLIAYEHALMFHPTADMTVIPSYSGGRRDYWVTPPAPPVIQPVQ